MTILPSFPSILYATCSQLVCAMNFSRPSDAARLTRLPWPLCGAPGHGIQTQTKGLQCFFSSASGLRAGGNSSKKILCLGKMPGIPLAREFKAFLPVGGMLQKNFTAQQIRRKRSPAAGDVTVAAHVPIGCVKVNLDRDARLRNQSEAGNCFSRHFQLRDGLQRAA